MIAPTQPAPTGNGLAMRMQLFLDALTIWADVDLVVVPGIALNSFYPPPPQNPAVRRIDLQAVLPDTHYRLLSRIADPMARVDAFKRYGMPSFSSRLSPDLMRILREIVARNDYALAHIGRAYMVPAVQALPDRLPLTLDLDEDDRESFATRARAARRRNDFALAEWLDQEGRACDELIVRFGQRFRCVFASNRQDCARLRRRHHNLNVQLVPSAVDIQQRKPFLDRGRTIIFVGSLRYQPNVDAIIWFARTVMPRLRARIGHCRLIIAGTSPPGAIQRLDRRPDVRVVGSAADLAPFYRRASLAIAPLQQGGGTRIKILEAAAFGLATVASREAADGLFTRHRPWGWIADDAAGFVDACAAALRDSQARDRMAMLAHRSVGRDFARGAVVPRLARILRDCSA